ncbi:MAG TPA: sigma-54 dependent transcriptional regulator [Ignavibacteriaceae bacterium]|nr:sigma-54 dependent transcriptional regulator [Ignavibacteriaceae bacterium]
MKHRILVIDDEPSFLLSVKKFLTTAPHYFEVETTTSPLTGLEMFRERVYDCVLLDIKIPALNGSELLKQMIQISPTVPIIMVSGQSSITMAVDCIRHGAFDYVEKPIDHNRLTVSLMNAIKMKQILIEKETYYEELKAQFDFIGSSKRILDVKELIKRAAPTDITVLITGETGTGKEVAAKAIHMMSNRKGGKMVTVNCAAIHKDLLESELFGHVKGAFTGASETRVGKIQAADKGTLFLDEIGDMSPELQAKMLRVLENQEISKVGEATSAKVDVRFVAATNKDLQELVNKGLFRQDLFYRLKYLHIDIPPLRERAEDIPELFNYFLVNSCEKHNKNITKVNSSVMGILKNQRWDGNIRELKHFVDRLILFTDGNEIGAEQIFRAFDYTPNHFAREIEKQGGSYKDHRKEFEIDFLREALENNNGNVKKTAEELGFDRSNLYKKLKALGLISKE